MLFMRQSVSLARQVFQQCRVSGAVYICFICEPDVLVWIWSLFPDMWNLVFSCQFIYICMTVLLRRQRKWVVPFQPFTFFFLRKPSEHVPLHLLTVLACVTPNQWSWSSGKALYFDCIIFLNKPKPYSSHH